MIERFDNDNPNNYYFLVHQIDIPKQQTTAEQNKQQAQKDFATIFSTTFYANPT
jgi:hypothetical protein